MHTEKITRLKKLLARELTPAEIDRFDAIQDTLEISDNDALWDLLIAMEYQRVYYEDIPRQISQHVEQLCQKIREIAEHETAIAQTKLAQAVVEQAQSLSIQMNLIAIAGWGALIVIAVLLAGSALMWAGYSIGAGQTHPPAMLLRMPVGFVAGGLSLGCGIFLLAQCAKGYADGQRDVKKLIPAAAAFVVPGAIFISMT